MIFLFGWKKRERPNRKEKTGIQAPGLNAPVTAQIPVPTVTAPSEAKKNEQPLLLPKPTATTTVEQKKGLFSFFSKKEKKPIAMPALATPVSSATGPAGIEHPLHPRHERTGPTPVPPAPAAPKKVQPMPAQAPTVKPPEKNVPLKEPREKKEEIPRRMRRFYRNREEQYAEGEPWKGHRESASGWKPENVSPMQSQDEFADVLKELRKESKQTGRSDRNQGEGELDQLAENIFEQSKRETKTEEVIQELRKKLGAPEPIPSGTAAPVEKEPAGQGHFRKHERPAKKMAGGQEMKTTGPPQPGKGQAELEQLKKTDFKDLLADEETGKKEKEAPKGEEEEEGLEELEETGEPGDSGDLENDLKSLGTEEGEELAKCPTCKKEAEPIFYCPECGTAFCKNCAKSFKKTGEQSFYVCPKCGTAVKED